MISPTPETDIHAMIHLVADAVALHAEHATARSYLLNGLIEMIGADCWAWTLSAIHPGRPPIYASMQHGGFSEEHFPRYLEAMEHPHMGLLLVPFAQGRMTRSFHLSPSSGTNGATDRFPSIEGSPLWLAADITSLIVSGEPLNGQYLSTIGIYRCGDQPFFSERESRIAHILLTEVPWLYADGWPEDCRSRSPSRFS